METTQTKSIFASKTVWGGIIAVVAGLAGAFGYNIDPALQTSIVELVASAASVVGGGVAIFGRIKATKAISSKAGS